MYHINPACTKRILASMPKAEFLQEFEKIRDQLHQAKPNTNEYFKFKRLYNWCISHYNNNLNHQERQSKPNNLTSNNTNGVQG